MNSKLNLYDALLGANVPADRARAVVEALEHEMYTVLATETDLAAQARLFNERVERLRAEIRADLAREIGGLRLEGQAGDASLREEMRTGFAEVRIEMARLAHTLTLRMGAGLAATAGVLVAAQQLL